MNIFGKLDTILSSEISDHRYNLSDVDIWVLRRFEKQKNPKLFGYFYSLFTDSWRKLFSKTNFPNGYECYRCQCSYPNAEDMFIFYTLDETALSAGELNYNAGYFCPRCIPQYNSGRYSNLRLTKCRICGRSFPSMADLKFGNYFPNGIKAYLIDGKPECITQTGKAQFMNICFDCLQKSSNLEDFLGTKSREESLEVLPKGYNYKTEPKRYFPPMDSEMRPREETYMAETKSPEECIKELGITEFVLKNTNEGFQKKDTFGDNDPMSILLRKGCRNYCHNDLLILITGIVRQIMTEFSSQPFNSIDEITKKALLEINSAEQENEIVISFIIPNDKEKDISLNSIKEDIRNLFNIDTLNFGTARNPTKSYLYYYPDVKDFLIESIRDSGESFSKNDLNALGVWSFTASVKTGDIEVEVDESGEFPIISVFLTLIVDIRTYPGDPFNSLHQ